MFLASCAAPKDLDATWAYVTSAEGTARLGINVNNIGLYGSSAGTSLAGGLAIRLNKKLASNKGTIQPKLVVLDRCVPDRPRYTMYQITDGRLLA